jgi:hypothetical protein
VKRMMLASLVAGCGDPNGFCPDHSPRTAKGCAVPAGAITIDGDDADWAAVPVPPATVCRDCLPGYAKSLRSAYTTDGRIAILIETEGAPRADADHSYAMDLRPIRGPSFFLSARFQNGVTPELVLNFNPIIGLPFEVAYTPSSIELAVPSSALPFNGGADLAVGLDVRDPLIDWTFEQVISIFATVCWDPDSPVCQPD